MLSDNDRQSLSNMYFKSQKFYTYCLYVLLESIDRKLMGECTRLQHAYRGLCSRLLYACLEFKTTVSRHVYSILNDTSVLNDYLSNVYQLSV